MAGSTGTLAGAGAKAWRTWGLAGVAAVLTVLTFYDYTRGVSERAASRSATQRERSPASATAVSAVATPTAVVPTQASPAIASGGNPWQEVALLRHFRDHAEQVRQRYQTVAVPYAEAVATFATLYTEGQAPREQAAQAIRGLVPTEVEVKDLLVAESGPAVHGVAWINATISLTSGDSQAMGKTLLTLGDAANGMVWKELSMGIDADRRRVQAKGQLAVLMLPQAE